LSWCATESGRWSIQRSLVAVTRADHCTLFVGAVNTPNLIQSPAEAQCRHASALTGEPGKTPAGPLGLSLIGDALGEFQQSLDIHLQIFDDEERGAKYAPLFLFFSSVRLSAVQKHCELHPVSRASHSDTLGLGNSALIKSCRVVRGP
jgi:hypothetical protein